MPVTAAQYETILRYLNNELSEDEEAAFITQMAADAALQKAFDTELLLQQKYLSEEDEDQAGEGFEPADKHIERVKNLTENKQAENNERFAGAAVIPFYKNRRFRAVAAAAILIIAGSALLYTFSGNRNNLLQNIGKSIQKDVNHFNDSLRVKSLAQQNQSSTDSVDLPELQHQYYARYSGSEDDPVEVSLYLEQYENKRFKELLKAQESDIETKGAADIKEQKRLTNYLLFYKSLAFLETAKPAKAAELLEKILTKNGYHDNLFYESQWYLLMSYLKLNDKNKAKRFVSDISSQKRHPYRMKALKIAEVLNGQN